MRKNWTSLVGALTALAVARAAVAQPEGEQPPPGDAPAAPPAAEDDPYGEPDEPKRPPPGGTGVLHGVLTDRETGQPVSDATVEIVGTEHVAITDEEGRYELELPPGNYTVRILSPVHEPIRARNVAVWRGGKRRIDAKLTPDEEAVEEFIVDIDLAEESSVEALALARQKSAAAGDTVGRSEISKTPASNAAQAAQRVVGATIEGSRFVFVRGLGGRYTNALLNGAPLPSPEPDRAAVPLDLFPTGILESLTIVKTFTPDVPADFAGGSIRVQTRRAPEKFLFQVSASGSYNTNTTFRERLSHRGSSTDFLGFDSGTRSLPSGIPTEYPLAIGVERPDGEFVLDPELKTHGDELNTFMSAQRKFTPPSPSVGVVVGDSFKLGRESRIGYLASLNYKQAYKIRKEKRRNFEPNDTEPSGLSIVNDVDVETGSFDVVWGSFGNIQYEPSRDHKLSLIGFHSQLADNDTRTFDGFWQRNDADLFATRLSFVSRSLNVLQLHGDHDFEALDDAHLDWNASYSIATRTEPDTRDVVYQLNDTLGAYVFVDGSESGRHFFSSQSEKAYAGGVDWTQPLSQGKKPTSVKLGAAASLKDREFSARRFAFRRIPGGDNDPFTCLGTTYEQECPDPLFVPDNIGTLLRLQENTFPEDAYAADLNVYAAYLMGDVSVTRDLRIILGERLEITRQSIDPIDQFDTGAEITGADLKATDALPALGVIYSATKKAKVRASVNRTLARPQLRELAPFAFSDFFGGDRTSGNPDLELTHITNTDLRFEYFPTLAEVLAFSVFFKNFDKPIETVVTPSGDSDLIVFQNAEGANLMGLELEARIGMKRFAKAIKDFTLVTNLTLARSRIELKQTDVGFLTNLSRPMVKQPPFVYNFAVDYGNEENGIKARVLYNVAGKRLVEVGADGLDDTYEHPRHQLDVTVAKDIGKHFEVKLTATNLINDDLVQTIGKELEDDKVIRSYRDGQTFKIGAKYKF